MSRPNFIKHWSEVIEPDNSHYRGSEELLSIGAPIGKATGLERIGVHRELLKPGRRTSWPHAESDEEEFVYVISGSPDVWVDGVLYSLKEGDAVGFPAGSGICHSFLNNSEGDVELLVVGERTKATNKVYYPLHPHRNKDIGESLWSEWPEREMGPHDGIPRKRVLTK